MGSRCRPKEGGASAAGRGDRSGDRDCGAQRAAGRGVCCGISCCRRTQRDAVPARGTVGSNTECGYATRPQPSTHKAQRPASAERRQDPRAVHDLRGSRSERGPSWQDLRAVHSRTPVCGAFRMHGANILPKPAHFGCTAAICCRELAFFPSEAPSGTHEAKKLPRIAAR